MVGARSWLEGLKRRLRSNDPASQAFAAAPGSAGAASPAGSPSRHAALAAGSVVAETEARAPAESVSEAEASDLARRVAAASVDVRAEAPEEAVSPAKALLPVELRELLSDEEAARLVALMGEGCLASLPPVSPTAAAAAKEKDAEGRAECPICFGRPPALNVTVCCKSPVCTACFVRNAHARTSAGRASRCPFCAAPGFAVGHDKGREVAANGSQNEPVEHSQLAKRAGRPAALAVPEPELSTVSRSSEARSARSETASVSSLASDSWDDDEGRSDPPSPVSSSASESAHRRQGSGGRLQLDEQAPTGVTPLHVAAQYGRLEAAAKHLQERKADANAQARGGITPLHVAAKTGHTDVASSRTAPTSRRARRRARSGRRSILQCATATSSSPSCCWHAARTLPRRPTAASRRCTSLHATAAWSSPS